MKSNCFLRRQYLYSIIIILLVSIINIGCYPAERKEVLTLAVRVTSSSTPITQTPIVIRTTNTPLATTTEYTTMPDDRIPTVTPLPMGTATLPPPILATATRPSVQITDSTNYMMVGNKMWYPDNIRMTEDVPLKIGTSPWSPDGHQLVGLNNDGNVSIFTLQTNDLETLDIVASSASSIRWSPNGQYLSYLVPVDIGGESARQLTIYNLVDQSKLSILDPIDSHDYISMVGWSYDSMKIAYIQWESSISDDVAIAVLKTIELETQQINEFSVPPPISILGGSWSPTQNQIVAYGYDTQELGKPEGNNSYVYSMIYLIDVDNNSSIEPLFSSSYEESEHVYYSNRPVNLFINNMPWSPDGKSIIYSDQGVICYLRLDSREETCLVDVMDKIITQTGAIGGEYPSWSATGEWIGFVLKFDSLFCSPLAAIKLDNDELKYTDEDVGDCALLGGTWSPHK